MTGVIDLDVTAVTRPGDSRGRWMEGGASATSSGHSSRSLGWAQPIPASVARTQQRNRPRPTKTGHRVAEPLRGLDRACGPSSDRSPATARTRRPQRHVNGDRGPQGQAAETGRARILKLNKNG
jgi:hypothetical protein